MEERFLIDQPDGPAYVSQALPDSGKQYMLLITGWDGQRASGMVHNLFVQTPYAFDGLDDAVFAMDGMMDALDAPQADTALRTFGKGRAPAQPAAEPMRHPQYWLPQSFCTGRPAVAVFYIQVRYRQHSTWQGKLLWKGHDKVCFRSVLELLRLLQSALARCPANQEARTHAHLAAQPTARTAGNTQSQGGFTT